jgi:DNA polymerase bacteriophage-type
MSILHIDFESRGVLDLRQVGLHRYARDPQTSPWCMAWAIGDMEPKLWVPNNPDRFDILPFEVENHVANGGAVYAHNAPFELEIWNHICVPRYGWPVLKPEQTFCTMAMAYAMGLPGALEDAALALGLSVLKDAEGRSLMLRMARPRALKGLPPGSDPHAARDPVWWDEPEKLARLYAYCQQDVRVERELHKRLMPLSSRERAVWLLDYKINQRGVAIDTETVTGAIKLADAMKEHYDSEISKLTDGAATICTALTPIKQWLAVHGVPEAADGLAKQDVVDILERKDLAPEVRQLLTARQEGGKASTAKFNVMTDRAGEDGRLRQMYQYHGAATGRWAGRAVQTHNLPRDMPKAETVEKILALIRAGEFKAIDMIYGPPLTMASKCLRSFFIAPPGKKLISGDWANIEGRGQAWFAGEEWKLKAFIAADNKTGPGIYELAYSRMFNVPVESVQNPSEERQVGKVSELAFGYQGGVGSGKTMGKTYGVHASDAQWADWRDAWRGAHPKTKSTWKEIENAAINAVRHPGEAYACGHPNRQARFKVVGSFLWLLLPSGRVICYPYPKILQGEFGPQLTYMSAPGQDKSKIVADPKNASNWARVSTYGGSLFNNIIQGTCRDFLADCMVQLDGAGADIVLHVHDEIVLETSDAKAKSARQNMEWFMKVLPPWAAGFPLHAECKITQRYGKG